MDVYLQTARMTVRRADDGDVADLLELHNDPAVMRYLSARPTSDREVREEILPSWRRLYAAGEGFGYWIAVERATGAFLGWFLFRPPRTDPEPGVVELGYRLCTAAWGRGFATEGSVALVDHGFAELGVQRVVADTMAVNAGSRHVMEKVGLRHVRTVHPVNDEVLEGSEHGDVEYELTRVEWAARRAGAQGPSSATPPR